MGFFTVSIWLLISVHDCHKSFFFLGKGSATTMFADIAIKTKTQNIPSHFIKQSLHILKT
jgi:hypothetical protein